MMNAVLILSNADQHMSMHYQQTDVELGQSRRSGFFLGPLWSNPYHHLADRGVTEYDSNVKLHLVDQNHMDPDQVIATFDVYPPH
jgi:hypothetical protein